MEPKAKRIEWVDALKGLGMSLVILGHMTIPEVARRLIFSFHMPLFFFLSGYLHRGQFSAKWVLRKVDSLLLPYVIYSAMTLVVWCFVGKCDPVLGLRAIGWGNGLGFTWFLTCLFVVDILGGIAVCSHLLSGKWAWGVVGVIAIFGWLMPRLGLPVVLKSNTVLAALAFWSAGYLMKGRVIRSWMLVPAIGLAALFPLGRIDMNCGIYGNGFLFYGTAMGFVVLLIWLFQRWKIEFKPLIFVGQRSLEFMCLHGLFPVLVTTGVLDSGLCIPKIVLRVSSFTLVVSFAWCIHRYCPVLAGRLSLAQRLVK